LLLNAAIVAPVPAGIPVRTLITLSFAVLSPISNLLNYVPSFFIAICQDLFLFLRNPSPKLSHLKAFSRAAETDRLSDKKDHVTIFVAELYSDNFYT